ncbi:unnamed protein product [Adineta ricciae]|uniref:Uncharacterized protein n=1 Tax=Adineta ricciae TaxID=249248 RepID=A0A815JI39_ADIRI|nr:unnamed protein product [Adineta ricciae]CAF1468211.1 unnamed protein product [Adineta ricciae]
MTFFSRSVIIEHDGVTKIYLRKYANQFHQRYATSRRTFHHSFYLHKSSTMSSSIDDVPILNIETTNNVINRDTVLIPSISLFRPTNVLRIFVFIEFLYVTIIWLIEGQTHSLIDDIIHFHLPTSLFDIVIISTIKLIAVVVLLTEFERFIIHNLYQPIIRRSFVSYKILFLIVLLSIIISSLAFGICKLTIVLRHDSLNKLSMSVLYVVVVLSASESFTMLWLYFYVKQMKLIARQPLHLQKKENNPRRMFSLVQSEKPWLLVAIVFLLIDSVIDAVDLLLYGRIIGLAVVEQESMHSVNTIVGIAFCLNLINSTISVLESWMFELVGQKMVLRFRKNVFNAIIKQDISFFDENRTGELTSRLSSDIQVVQDSMTGHLASLIQSLIHIVGSLIVMFYLNFTLTLVLVVIVPIVVLIVLKFGNIVENLRKKFQDQLAITNNIADESFVNIRTVRIFGAENKIQRKYKESLTESLTIGKKLALIDGIFSGVLQVSIAVALSAILWYGAKQLHDKKLSAGVLASFLLYMLQLAFAFASIAEFFTEFMKAVGASKRLFELIDREPSIPTTTHSNCSIKPIDYDGSVRFDHVCFTYPSRPEQQVLTDISFVIEPGKKVALIGPSGCGKSTIASLIERFYDPQSGEIYLGRDVLSSIDPQWLRENVSFVNQEPILFACSILGNITFGLDRNQVSFDDVVRAAKQANAHQFIERLEHQYDTLVGERGVGLSTGQKQRIAIARSLLINPKLLLLDEATSALDAESEHLICEAIERAMINRSVLIIAHRLSTVINADLIIVIDQGKIVERGTHQFLINNEHGLYKQLLLRQMPLQTLRTFRETACAFYLTSISVANIIELLAALFVRILSEGFAFDIRQIPFICKIQVYIAAWCSFVSFTHLCLATIDQFLSMSKYRRFSNLRVARLSVSLTWVFWTLYSIPILIYWDVSSNVCKIVSPTFAIYATYFQFLILYGVAPITIMSTFSILAFYNARTVISRRMNIVRLSHDRQLTAMTLIHVTYVIITILPYVIYFVYSVNLTGLNAEQTARNRFIYDITILIYYSSFAGSFYIYSCVSQRFRKQFAFVCTNMFQQRIDNQVAPANE